jgi:uncharacterized membrane protein
MMDEESRKIMITAFAGRSYAEVQLVAFAKRPGLISVHAVAGVVFAAIAPLQFWARLRARFRQAHRANGYALILTMAVLAISGVAVSIVYPFAGLAGIVPNVFWLGFLAVCMTNALRQIRRRDLTGHQTWMTRAVAATLGITLSRLYLPLLTAGLGVSSRTALATVFWVGAGSSLLIAEIWLRSRGRRVRR